MNDWPDTIAYLGTLTFLGWIIWVVWTKRP